jgi:hypothetical protein
VIDEKLYYTMDWDLFIRIGKRFPVDYIPEYLGSIREHGTAKTTVGGRKRLREIKQLTRRHGTMRYSMAYFNYAVDTYWKMWFHDGEENAPTHGIAIRLRRFLGMLFSKYTRRFHQGQYKDGWVGKKAMVVKPNYFPTEACKEVIVTGVCTKYTAPMKLTVNINKTENIVNTLGYAGEFTLTIPIPECCRQSDSFHIALKSSKSFKPGKLGINTDKRKLGFLLKSIDIVVKSRNESVTNLISD